MFYLPSTRAIRVHARTRPVTSFYSTPLRQLAGLCHTRPGDLGVPENHQVDVIGRLSLGIQGVMSSVEDVDSSPDVVGLSSFMHDRVNHWW